MKALWASSPYLVAHIGSPLLHSVRPRRGPCLERSRQGLVLKEEQLPTTGLKVKSCKDGEMDKEQP